MKISSLPLIILAFALNLNAEEPVKLGTVTTLRGKTYENVVISSVEPDGIRVTHKDGAAKLPFTNLSSELRAQFAYDSTKAEDFQQDKATRMEQALAQQKSQQQQLQSQQQQDAFQAERRNFLERMLAATDLTNLQVEMEFKLSNCRATNQTEWVKMLEEDMLILKKRMANVSASQAELRNAQLRNEIASLRTELRSISQSTAEANRRAAIQSSSWVNDPFSYTPRTYVVPVQQRVYVPYCPTPTHNYAPAQSTSQGRNLCNDIRIIQ
jgi:hypothetical protein